MGSWEWKGERIHNWQRKEGDGQDHSLSMITVLSGIKKDSFMYVLCLAVAILNFSFMFWCWEFGKRKLSESVQSMMMSPLFKIDYSPLTIKDP